MSDCIQWKCFNSTASPPRCQYVDSYPLGDEIYVLRICQLEGSITLDIRLFRDKKWTCDGIQLNKMQWQYLKNSVNHIDSSLPCEEIPFAIDDYYKNNHSSGIAIQCETSI